MNTQAIVMLACYLLVAWGVPALVYLAGVPGWASAFFAAYSTAGAACIIATSYCPQKETP
jgi:predicted MFS family arabinose efflux permease